jgi:hypothetical protein
MTLRSSRPAGCLCASADFVSFSDTKFGRVRRASLLGSIR